MRYRSTASQYASGSNPGCSTTVPPLIHAGTTKATDACEIGVAARKRKSSVGSCHPAMHVSVIVDDARCVWSTPFGRPVVPPE